MEPRFENRGGLIGQLRDLALRGSDNSWEEELPQDVVVARRTSMRHSLSDSLEVEFIAKKRLRTMGGSAVHSFFTLKASYIESLPFEFLPENIIEALRRKKIRTGEIENEEASIVMKVGSTEDEEYDEHEFDGYDQLDFCHRKSLQYNLNGRGSLVDYVIADMYEDTTDGDSVLIDGYEVTQAGSHTEEERKVLDLQAWGAVPSFVSNSDATGFSGIEPDEELKFYDIVKNYSENKKLLRTTQGEHHKSMLALVAFLRMEASTKDIIDLL